jgi:uncharacterized membrane protein YfcA
VVAVGACIQGSVGFGLNLVAAPVLAVIDPRLVPGPALVAALVLTLLVAVRDRASVDVRGIGWAFGGRVPGTVAGAAAVALLPGRRLELAFACAVLLAVALSAHGWHLPRTRATLFGAGALSGLMGTVSSIGGPPMALVYQRSPGAELRATLSSFFVVGAALSIGMLALVGRFGWTELRASAFLLPALGVGFFASRYTAHLLDRGLVRPAVLVLSAGAALAVLVRALV